LLPPCAAYPAGSGNAEIRRAIAPNSRRGKTAHGGAPQQGVNAIEKVVEYIRRPQARAADAERTGRRPCEGAACLISCVVHAGLWRNAMADPGAESKMRICIFTP